MKNNAIKIGLAFTLYGVLGMSAFANDVNPLTGVPLAMEQRQRRLEELKLETQMLEEQAKQAEIRSRIDGRSTPVSLSNGSRTSVELPVFPVPEGGVARRAGQRAKAVSRLPQKSPITGGVASVVNGIALKPATQVNAIFRTGDMRRAVVQVNGETYTVAEGDTVAGLRVGTITDTTVTIGDNGFAMERRAAIISGVEGSGAQRSTSVSASGAWPPEFKPAAMSLPAAPVALSGGPLMPSAQPTP